MLGLIIDAAVMFAVIAWLTGETPDFLTALLVSFGFAIALVLCFVYLGGVGGLIACVPLVGLFGVILSALYGAPLKWAVVGSLGFLVYKIGMSVLWMAILK